MLKYCVTFRSWHDEVFEFSTLHAAIEFAVHQSRLNGLSDVWTIDGTHIATYMYGEHK